MTKENEPKISLKARLLSGLGALVLLGGIQGCGVQTATAEQVLTSFSTMAPLTATLARDTTVPAVDSVVAVLRQGARVKKIPAQLFLEGKTLKLDSVEQGGSFTVAVTGFESSGGARVARWWSFVLDTAGNSDSTHRLVLTAVKGPSLDSIPKLDSLKVGVKVPATKGLWITSDSTDPRVSTTAKRLDSALVLSRALTYKVALRRDSVPSLSQPSLWSAVASWNVRRNAAVPVFSVAAGTYGKAFKVALTDSVSGATLLWSRDSLAWNVYKDSIALDSTGRIFARAAFKGMDTSRTVSASYELKVVAPVLSTAAGTYERETPVRFSSLSGGVSYRCSEDSLAWEACPDSVTLFKSGKLFVQAMKSGWTSSGVVSASYELKVKAPVLSPASGSFGSEQKVVLSDSTAGVAYRCSSDSAAWLDCKDTVSVSQNGKLFVFATKSGWTASAVATGRYEFKVKAPSLSPASGVFSADTFVVLTDSVTGTAYRCSSDSSAWSDCKDTVPVSQNGKLFVSATKSGWTASAVATGRYEFKAKAPVFSVVAGTYTQAQTVRITSPTAGATVECSLGEAAWAACNDPVQVLTSQTLRARSVRTGWTASDTASVVYAIEPVLAKPASSLASGVHDTLLDVALSAEAGATIRYSLDKETWSTYAAPVRIGASDTLYAYATKVGNTASDTLLAMFELKVPVPKLEIVPDGFGSDTTRALVDASGVAGVTLWYSEDAGTTFVEYSQPLDHIVPKTVLYYAAKAGWTNSDTTTVTF